jgi:hypothetical protein
MEKPMKTALIITSFLTIATIIPACSDDPSSLNSSSENAALTQQAIESIPSDSLSGGELESLLFMVEEEKVARDVYMLLYAKWNLKPFNNISQSEQQHMDAVCVLLDRYSIAKPSTIAQIGTFENDDLQNLHDNLLVQGQQSLIEALKVGALIEEVDIKDLQDLLETTVDNADITYVYQNLIKGSENHLRAYVKNLTKQGVVYEPQVLDVAHYQSIISQ